MDERDVQFLKDGLAILLAVETLEYKDKNWLAGSEKTRSENKRELMIEMANALGGVQ